MHVKELLLLVDYYGLIVCLRFLRTSIVAYMAISQEMVELKRKIEATGVAIEEKKEITRKLEAELGVLGLAIEESIKQAESAQWN